LGVGEADIDRNSALLLLQETVRIDPGQSLDERGFAVVDMACGADNKMGHLRVISL
jgi:hypothetical protein